ncbi:hypothetical protein PILCRDRAFT_719267 [Piloderma croceum F 1598]|uniref:NACHT domain-containing protein n=1 Tax=Piloderma croceum (strain F 1598) TaxID=765440 RepID=A0A0C3F0S1_PILCF|nr:hypothetical protein PILCRDRAFT_719267 [Piloderma croceum F 1598]
MEVTFSPGQTASEFTDSSLNLHSITFLFRIYKLGPTPMAFRDVSYFDASYGTLRVNHADRDLYITQINTLDETLRKLEPARMDACTRIECLPGTRTDILQSIDDWQSNTEADQRILWLHGLAGSGKSILATTIANLFSERGYLGAFVFFDRDVKERNQSSNVIRTIAHQLGSFNALFGTSIAAVINDMPRILLSPLSLQFTKLIVEPLSTLPWTGSSVVIVLDALDECADRKLLLAILAAESIRLPSFIRIIITSRDEFDLRAAFAGKVHISVQELDISTERNVEDISAFLQIRMKEIRDANVSLRLPPDWPGDASVRALGQRAAGLFAWASTACHFIDGYDPQHCLGILLQGTPCSKAESALDTLYRTALQSIDLWDDGEFCADFHLIMGTILVAKDPLSHNAIDALLSPKRPSRHIISRLRCVLSWSDTEPIRILHPSFAEFLSDHLRCGSDSWYINTLFHNRSFAIQCLNYLEATLRRNCRDLKLSLAPVNEVLLEATSYACATWMDHVIDIREEEETVANILEKFLFRHLLHWIEGMSILKKSRTTVASVPLLHDWLRLHLPHRTKLHELIGDASQFVRIFASSIEEHPLLVYLGALPFTPKFTLLYKTYNDCDIPWIPGGYNRWPPSLQTFSGYKGRVTCVAFAPDGTQIVTSHRHGEIRVWNVSSGAYICASPIENEKDFTSVAISSDGQRIASGSWDSTVRLWDTGSGKEVLPSMRGHVDGVLSVAFSPNGTQIASGSNDNTICVWDTTSGCQVLPRLCGHMNRVSAVIFTPDGSHIISGSHDRTIRVWDVAHGTETLQTFPHTCHISSLAVSSNGKWIASGFADGTICILDAMTGVIENLCFHSGGHLFGGHLFETHVIFLPNSTKIASILMSDSTRVHVWDAISGTLLSTSARCMGLHGIAISPNGDQLVIEYGDATIGLWNVASAEEEEEYVQSQQRDSIISLAFSHCGKQVATVQANRTVSLWDPHLSDIPAIWKFDTSVLTMAFSSDSTLLAIVLYNRTICIWDTASGQQTTLLQRNNTSNKEVTCVAFSPDGHWIAWGCDDGCDDTTVHLWDLKQEVEISSTREPRGVIFSVIFSPDGMHVLCAQCDSTVSSISIWLWDTTSNTVSHLGLPLERNFFDFSMKFSPDGLYIKIAQGRTEFYKGNIQIWDRSGHCLVGSRNYLHHECVLSNPIIITHDAWIVHVETGTVIGKLPSIVSIRHFAASNTSIAFTTKDQPSTLITMHFPSTTLTSREMWNPAAYEEDSGFEHDFYCGSSAEETSSGHNTDDSDSDNLAVD